MELEVMSISHSKVEMNWSTRRGNFVGVTAKRWNGEMGIRIFGLRQDFWTGLSLS